LAAKISIGEKSNRIFIDIAWFYLKLTLFSTGAIAVTGEIDQLLADWKNKLAAASQNLLELQELPTYQRLAGVQLTGITAARVTPALAAMNDLFQYFDVLAQTVDKAAKLRQQLPRLLVSAQKIAEIKQLLLGDSILLAVEQIPIAERELLSSTRKVNAIPAGGVAIAPADLLTVMTHTFSNARDTVLAVDTAWAKLDTTLAEAEVQINSLEQLAASLGQDSVSELMPVRAAITALKQRSEQDPLGVTTEIEQQIQPLITQVKALLTQLAQQQIQVREQLTTARTALEKLQEIHSQSWVAFTESQEKVMDHSVVAAPLASAQIDALSQWLEKLETKFAEGLVNPVMIGLNNWLAKAKEYTAITEQVYNSHTHLLQTRRELRGRLDALQAKALAVGLIEDETLTRLATQAKQLLYTRPTPLNQAAQLVTEYEQRLNKRLKIA
jgi:TolA-binding protein